MPVIRDSRARRTPAPRRLAAVACSLAIGLAWSSAHALTAQQEKDEILTLLAYSIAYSDWQTGVAPVRGRNVASVLLDSHGNIVFWGRNCETQRADVTQHADVVTMEKYLAGQPGLRYLSSYTLYTTLDPCAMCAGMTIMGYLSRVVYGQTDSRAGGVLQIYISAGKDFTVPTPVASPTTYRTQLENAFQQSGMTSVDDWLFSTAALDIFRPAHDHFVNDYTPQYGQNATILNRARQVLLDAEARGAAVCNP
jgi:tRNA(Arg) A34 adenosine deaminase TadA